MIYKKPSAFGNNAGQACTSNYKGVHWDPRAQKWCSRLQYNGKSHWLGRFKSERAAAERYSAALANLVGH